MERFKATARCTTDSVMRHFAYPVMEPHPDGDYVPYAAAQAEIARLTQRAEKAEADLQAVKSARDMLGSLWAKVVDERDEVRLQLRHMQGFDCCTCFPCVIHSVEAEQSALAAMRKDTTK